MVWSSLQRIQVRRHGTGLTGKNSLRRTTGSNTTDATWRLKHDSHDTGHVGCLPDSGQEWMEKIPEDDRKMNYDLMKVAREQQKFRGQKSLDLFGEDKDDGL